MSSPRGGTPDGAADVVRRLIRSAGRRRDMRQRRPPDVSFSNRIDREPTIYYLCPDDNAPIGGIRNIYRHVDVLNDIGLAAAVLHTRPGFRCDWFANSTRVVHAGEVTVSPADLLVVPEFNAPLIEMLPPAARKVIFDQNVYAGLDQLPLRETGAAYQDAPGVLATLVVSRDNAALLSYAFPELTVHVARPVINGAVFHPRPSDAPRPSRRIAYMPRRRLADQQQLRFVLRRRAALAEWSFIPIDGMSESATAETMRTCPIFLSFSEREGFGLPPAEAMATGAYVVGFTGLGGRDFLDPAYCTPVAEADLLGFAMGVEAAATRFDRDPESVLRDGRTASDRILSVYHEAGLAEDLSSFYRNLF
jgi:glycosyltransferase involved in cell wall biosynthesis